jgi:hypothetical protein
MFKCPDAWLDRVVSKPTLGRKDLLAPMSKVLAGPEPESPAHRCYSAWGGQALFVA